MATLHLGLSGYDYKEWQGDGLFYPADLKKSRYLEYYASRFNSLESNGTFQRIPSEATIQKWINTTPENFTFSPKMVQTVTHFKRLNEEAIVVAREFCESLKPLAQAQKLGPIFLQLPPNLKQDISRLSSFLTALTREFPYRWAIEFRNDTWHDLDVQQLLKEMNVAWVQAETDGSPTYRADTADFSFIRLRRLVYDESALKEWAIHIQSLLDKKKDVYVYCRHKDTDGPWQWADSLTTFLRT